MRLLGLCQVLLCGLHLKSREVGKAAHLVEQGLQEVEAVGAHFGVFSHDHDAVEEGV